MTDVVLYWGIGLDPRPNWDEEASGEWGPWALERLGMNVPPHAPAAERLFREETGCTFDFHGSLEPNRQPEWFLAISESVLRVGCGEMAPVPPAPSDLSAWRESLLETAEELGLSHEGEPGWRISVLVDG